MIFFPASGTIPITLDTAKTNPLPFVHSPAVQAMVAQIVAPPPPATLTPEFLTPVFADDARSVALYHADALEILQAFAPESFDMVFADPPYFLSGGGGTCQNGKWASVNKGAWDTAKATLPEIHDFNRAWLALCHRLLKPDGTIWVTGTNHNIYSIGYALAELGFKVLNDIAWFKINPPPNLSCRYFTHATETVIWAKKNVAARHYFDYAAMKALNGGRQMQSLWAIAPPKPREKRHGKHPTQKPEALLERIVRATTKPGDVVLDPFCGSGTTGVVCARLGRGFVGVEREAAYLGVAAARVGEELSELPDSPTRYKVANRVRERKIRYKTKTVIIDQG